MKHLDIQWRSWLVKYFASYLLVGLLPVLVFGTTLYFYNRITMHKEVRANHFSALTQSIGKMDALLEEMNEMAYHLSTYTYPNGLDYANFRQFSLEDQSLIAQRLVAYQEQMAHPAQLLLFVRGDQYIYTSEGRYHYTDYEKMLALDADLTRSRFYTLLNTAPRNTSVKLKSPQNAQTTVGNTSYLYPIPTMAVLPEATLGFLYNDEVLRSVFENHLGNIHGNLYIYNDYLNVIYESEKTAIPAQAVSSLAGMKGTGVFEQTLDNREVVVMRGVSDISGVSFVVVAPVESFYDRVYSMQNLLLLIIFCQFAVGFVLAWILSRHSYHPVRQLISTMHGEDELLQGDEFVYLGDSWQDLTSKNQELNTLLDQQRPMVVDAFLGNLLRGKSTDDCGVFTLRCDALPLDKPCFFVLVMTALDTSYAGLGTASQSLHHIIQQAEQQLEGLCHLYALELIAERRVAVVVNCDDSAGPEDQDVRRQVAQLLHELIGRENGPSVQMGIGSICVGQSRINESFMQALVVLADYFPSNRAAVMTFEDVVTSESENYQYPVIEQSLFIQSLKQADKVVALRALEEMVQKIGENESVLFMQCLCYDVINLMMKTFAQLNGEVRSQDIKALCNFTNLTEFLKRTQELTVLICDQQEQFKEAKTAQLRSELILYVNAHFQQPEICLESMSQAFGLSSNYLSRFFKQETGYNFIQYLSYLRLEWVKEQLSTTNRQIKDIVLEVGYLDVASFVRKFKSSEGLTPSQYRHLKQCQ